MRFNFLFSFFLLSPLFGYSQYDTLSFSRDFAKWQHSRDTFENKLKTIIQILHTQMSSNSVISQKDEKIQNLRDSISTLKENSEKEQKKAELLKKISTLEKDTFTLNQSVRTLEIIIKNLNSLVSQAKQDSINSNNKSFSDGENSYIEKLATHYVQRGNDFDSLIKHSNQTSISRDLKLVRNYDSAFLVLNDLDIYFKCLDVLKQPYNKSQVDFSLGRLRQIKRSSNSLNNLRTDISSYIEITKSLNGAIDEISRIDANNVPANGNSQLQKERFSTVIEFLSNFLYDNEKYANYPFLQDVLFNIISRKRVNADARITDLLIKVDD